MLFGVAQKQYGFGIKGLNGCKIPIFSEHYVLIDTTSLGMGTEKSNIRLAKILFFSFRKISHMVL